MYEKNTEEPKKSKKNIKWYAYADQMLDNKLKNFMEQFDIKKQAKLIRDCVNYYIDFYRRIYQKGFQNGKYDNKYINEQIMNAIDDYEIGITFYEELKQKLSPLKTLILLLNDFEDKPNKLVEIINDLKKGFDTLEQLLTQYFEEPEPIRYVKRFDILHIEDNQLDRRTIRRYFESKSKHIKSVETSEEGFEVLKVSMPKVILLDIDLKTSKIDGDKVCKMLKSSEQYKDIPVILMTAVISKKDKKEIQLKTGADEVILKPISKLADLDIILKFLNKREYPNR